MGYSDQRALAEAALQYEGSGKGPGYPNGHLTALRERRGWSEQELRRWFENPNGLTLDLDAEYESHLFQCQSVAELLHLATVLNSSVPEVLFGDEPPTPVSPVLPAEVTARLRSTLAAERLTPEALGDRLGWAIEPVLTDPQALETFNIQGLRDICSGVGVDWLSVIAALEQARRTMR